MRESRVLNPVGRDAGRLSGDEGSGRRNIHSDVLRPGVRGSATRLRWHVFEYGPNDSSGWPIELRPMAVWQRVGRDRTSGQHRRPTSGQLPRVLGRYDRPVRRGEPARVRRPGPYVRRVGFRAVIVALYAALVLAGAIALGQAYWLVVALLEWAGWL